MAKPIPATRTIKKKTSAENPLKDKFLQHLQASKKEILVFAIVNIFLGALLLYCYPYPDTTSDSGGYIRWATENTYGGPRPLGYSWFLNLLHSISTGPLIVFLSQFIIYTSTQLFFYLSCTFFFNISNRYLRYTFLALSLGFISGIYTTDTILSDNLFLSLTILLISLTLWFVQKPGIYMFAAIAATCMACIIVRYTGLFYPFILGMIFFLSLNTQRAVAATAIIGIMVAAYIYHVADETEKTMGVNVFSAFSGWQKANNACHIVPYLDHTKPFIEADDPDLQFTDSILHESYSVLATKYPGPDEVSYAFIWIDSLPLKQILYRKVERERWKYYNTWNYLGVVFNDYGNELIKEYPLLYFRYFIYNNAKRLLHPDNETLSSYQSAGAPTKYERQWFKWRPEQKIEPRNDLFRPILRTLPATYTLLWGIFAGVLLAYPVMLYKKIINRSSPYFIPGLIFIVFILMYAAANIISAPVNTRFLMPVRSCIIVLAVFCVSAYLQYKDVQTKA